MTCGGIFSTSVVSFPSVHTSKMIDKLIVSAMWFIRSRKKFLIFIFSNNLRVAVVSFGVLLLKILIATFLPRRSINIMISTYPSPVSAQHACICHWCFLIDVKSNWRDISAADIEPFKSYYCVSCRNRKKEW